MNCRMCHDSNLGLFLDLGFIPLVDRFLSEEDLNKPETLYPLNVYLCKNCGLVQLGYIVPAKELFNENYAYESSTTKGRRENHNELAKYICETFSIPKGSLVVDIGSNVGVLLTAFKTLGMEVFGIDASANIVRIANSNGIETILGFFDNKMVNEIISRKQKAEVVTATNLFAHIQDYDSFAISLKSLLTDDGIFVFQVPHLVQLLRHLEYDTIYHEHISYFGLRPLIQFFKKHDMELFDVLETDIDGGSIRCFVCRKGLKLISKNVEEISRIENNEDIYSIDRLLAFSNDVRKQKEQLVNLLVSLRQNGKKVVAVGAPAKGMTLLNYCKIDKDLLPYVTEKAPLKIGKFTPGMHIPVRPDDMLMKEKPDYALILAWNFSQEIMKNLQQYSNSGGKFIVPIPHPHIT